MKFDHLPDTLEPKGEHLFQEGANSSSSNEFYSSNTNSATEEDEEGLLKNYLSARRLPSLDILQHNTQQDDYIRIKLSGMSVCVSPKSPRGQTTLERGAANEFFSTTTAAAVTTTKTKPFDPIRSNTSLRRIMEVNNGRRHSIANIDSNRPDHDPSSSAYQEYHQHYHRHHNYNHNHQHNHQHKQPTPLPQHQHLHLHHYCHYPKFPGHYSAPSSPPLLPISKPKHNDAIPQHKIPSIRRNSSALVYREKSTLETRRMSLNQYFRNSHIGKSVEEEHQHDTHIKDDAESLYSRSPELRISHKLAERKRRKEMKDLFEELKNVLPVDKTLKTSKWEILTKAVEYISLLRKKDQNMEQELMSLKHQLEILKK